LAGSFAVAPWVARADVVYVSNNINPFNVEKFTSSGVGSTFATGLNGATGIAFDAAGNLYTANQSSHQITQTTPGGGTSVFTSGLATSSPFDIAFDKSGNLYVTGQDSSDHVLEKVTPGGVASVIHDFGSSTTPAGLAFDSAGNLFIATYGSADTIEKFSSTGADLGAFASTPGTSSQGHISRSLAFDGAGNLYVTTQLNNTIWKYAPNGSKSVFASGGPLDNPYGLAFDSAGNLFTVSLGNDKIVKFSPDGSSSTVFATSANGLNGPQFLAITDDNGVPLPLANQATATPLPSSALAGLVLLGGMGVWKSRRLGARDDLSGRSAEIGLPS
jgi:sugar lactone lactonase YvrE